MVHTGTTHTTNTRYTHHAHTHTMHTHTNHVHTHTMYTLCARTLYTCIYHAHTQCVHTHTMYTHIPYTHTHHVHTLPCCTVGQYRSSLAEEPLPQCRQWLSHLPVRHEAALHHCSIFILLKAELIFFIPYPLAITRWHVNGWVPPLVSFNGQAPCSLNYGEHWLLWHL